MLIAKNDYLCKYNRKSNPLKQDAMKKLLFLLLACCAAPAAHGQYLKCVYDPTTARYGYKETDRKEWSLPPEYRSASEFGEDNLATVGDGERKFVIDMHGNKVSPDFKSIAPRTVLDMQPYICQDMEGNFNLYDTQFNPICDTSFEHLFYLTTSGLVAFKSGGLYGLMDAEGNVLAPPSYVRLSVKNYYPICQYKGCDLDGISMEMFEDALVEAQNEKGKYGFVTPGGEVVVPFSYGSSYDVQYKGLRKAFNKTVRPYLLSSKRQELVAHINEATRRSIARNEELAAIYPTDLPAVEPVTVRPTADGFAFFKAGEQVSKTYESIDTFRTCSVVRENGKYGVADPLGAERVACQYDDISLWNAEGGKEILLAETNDHYGLMAADGAALPAWWCEMIYPFANNVGVAVKDGQYWLLDARGNFVSRHGYADIDNFADDGKIYAEYFGYRTELTADGGEVTPIVKQVFDEAYNLDLTTEAQAKYDKYILCIALDGDNRAGYHKLALNNIGIMFEQLGDVDKALAFYEMARDLGNEQARKNIQRIRVDRTVNALQQAGDALAQIAQSIDLSGTTSTGGQQGGGSDQTTVTTADEGAAASAAGSGTKRSYDFYKQQYDRWERIAQSCCESASKSKMGTASLAGMQMNLRQAKKKMREVRAKARKDGYDIPQSMYETATISR